MLRVQARAKVKHSNVLSSSIYFSNLDDDSISKIIDAMDCLVIEENTIICQKGDVADMFYCIVSGTWDTLNIHPYLTQAAPRFI